MLIYLATFGVHHKVLDAVVHRLFAPGRCTAEAACITVWALALLGYGDTRFWRQMGKLGSWKFAPKQRRLVDSRLPEELLA